MAHFARLRSMCDHSANFCNLIDVIDVIGNVC